MEVVTQPRDRPQGHLQSLGYLGRRAAHAGRSRGVGATAMGRWLGGLVPCGQLRVLAAL